MSEAKRKCHSKQHLLYYGQKIVQASAVTDLCRLLMTFANCLDPDQDGWNIRKLKSNSYLYIETHKNLKMSSVAKMYVTL